jgi:RimJ/RimL family protein N-acetyltransferase
MRNLIPLTIETPRLHLRMFELSDWDDLHAMLSVEECVRYTFKTPFTKWQTWRMLAAYPGHWHLRGFGPYAVVEKSSGRMMGPVGLWYPGDWPEPEMKYSLAQEFWGKGYATEAAQAIKEIAVQDLKWKRLISLIMPGNVASEKVAQRLGGIFEKRIPFRDGEANIFAYDLSRSSSV